MNSEEEKLAESNKQMPVANARAAVREGRVTDSDIKLIARYMAELEITKTQADASLKARSSKAPDEHAAIIEKDGNLLPFKSKTSDKPEVA